ncbi:MAG: ribonuclease Z [Actinomycetes bacterium]
MEMAASFVGTAGSVPTARRGLPALLLRHGSTGILFDCGEGTQRQLTRSVGLFDLDAVFITHYHADHWLGLPGLLKTFELRERTRPLPIFGPKGLHRTLAFAEAAVGRTRFELQPSELEPTEGVEFAGLTVSAFDVDHRGPAFGYVAHEPPRPGRVDLERAAALGIEPGPDMGKLQRGESVAGVDPGDVLGEQRPGRKVVISGDTRPCDSLAIAAHGADLLIHEATFLDSEADRAHEKAHSTARQAAELARDSGVRMLALTHISSRYAGGEIADEARATFENSFVARDFDRVELPFAEKGEPVLERSRRADDRKTPDADQPAIVSTEV